MNSQPPIFEFEHSGETVVATPCADLREFDFERIQEGAEQILKWLDEGKVRNVVIDFEKTDVCGSTALEFFVKLWKHVRSKEGRMAFCGVSEHEREILKTTNLDQLWPICATQQDALAAVRG